MKERVSIGLSCDADGCDKIGMHRERRILQ